MDGLAQIRDLLQQNELSSRYEGLVKVVDGEGGLVLLNYTDACQRFRRWDAVTILCRGLILRRETGEVIARPFPKFFNWGEHQGPLPAEPFSVVEKVDGSLGISYRRGDALYLATRGSFTSVEAQRGTAHLRALPGVAKMPEHLTFLFEIVARDANTVVKYDFDGLILLGVIDRHTGRDAPADEVDEWARELGCRAAQRFSFSSLEDVLATKDKLPANLEGYVIRFASGLRVKLKGDAYLSVLRAALGVSMGKVLAALLDGEEGFRAYLQELPEELAPDAERFAAELRAKATALEAEARAWFVQAPQGVDRKSLAQWVFGSVPAPFQKLMFSLQDGKPISWLALAGER